MPNKIRILVVDDSKDDVFFLCRAFEKAGFNNLIVHVSDGEKAVAYLSGENGFTDRSRFPLPKLMLLDVKMPGRVVSMCSNGCAPARTSKSFLL